MVRTVPLGTTEKLLCSMARDGMQARNTPQGQTPHNEGAETATSSTRTHGPVIEPVKVASFWLSLCPRRHP
jgi:hypothetical protein